MINSLTGRISGHSESTLLLQTEAGVEWALMVPASTLQQIGNAEGADEEVRLFTYLHHREDQMSLFAFASEAERSVFLDLLKVGGIGPKQALRILSGMSVESFVKCLDAEDIDNLSRIPGLGRKTAQKILLTLRGKLSLQTESKQEQTGGHDDIVQALVDMGFDRRRSTAAVKKAAAEVAQSPESKSDPGSEEREIFKKAIVTLSAHG